MNFRKCSEVLVRLVSESEHYAECVIKPVVGSNPPHSLAIFPVRYFDFELHEEREKSGVGK